jgi:hypothetical protein
MNSSDAAITDFNEIKRIVLHECLSDGGFLWKARFDCEFDEEAFRRLTMALDALVELWKDQSLIDKKIVEAVFAVPMILENLSPHFERRKGSGTRLIDAGSEVFEILGRLFQTQDSAS